MSDHQVGVSDLGDRGYPWAHQSNPRHEHGPHNSSAHLRHLEIGAHITYGNSHPSFNHDSHGLFIRRFPELPSSHPYNSVPTKPLPMTAASFCHRQLGPISRPQAPSAIGPPFLPSTDPGQHLPRAWLQNNNHRHSPGQEIYPGPTYWTVPEDSPCRLETLGMALPTIVPLPDRVFWSGPCLYAYLVVSTCDCQSVA